MSRTSGRDAAGEQLTLALPEPELHLIAICVDCGPIAKVRVEGGPSGRWDAAEKWCYIARVEHDRQTHPERTHP